MTRPLAARLTHEQRQLLSTIMANEPAALSGDSRRAAYDLLNAGLVRRGRDGLWRVCWENIPHAPCTDMAWSAVERRLGLAP